MTSQTKHRPAAQDVPDSRATRFEVIDATGRAYTAYNASIEFDHQDEGRTIKAFIRDRNGLGDEVDPEDLAREWRRLALQFDGHRMEAISLIRGLSDGEEWAVNGAAAFLAAEPLGGEEVLRERISDMVSKGGTNYQARVDTWMQACFSKEIRADRLERGDRLLEEVLELLQSGGYPEDRIGALAEYVYAKPVGDAFEEVGDVMVTLSAYATTHGISLAQAGDKALDRNWPKTEKIREKQRTKPVGSALPTASAPRPTKAWSTPDDERPEGKDLLMRLQNEATGEVRNVVGRFRGGRPYADGSDLIEGWTVTHHAEIGEIT